MRINIYFRSLKLLFKLLCNSNQDPYKNGGFDFENGVREN